LYAWNLQALSGLWNIGATILLRKRGPSFRKAEMPDAEHRVEAFSFLPQLKIAHIQHLSFSVGAV